MSDVNDFGMWLIRGWNLVQWIECLWSAMDGVFLIARDFDTQSSSYE